jgi:PAS domain S-box-containing protein
MTKTEPLSEGDYRLIFENAPWPCLILRPDLTIALASRTYLEATGLEEEVILNRPLLDVFQNAVDDASGETVRSLRASLERVRSTHQPDSIAVEGQGGQTRSWSLVNAPVVDPAGMIAYIVHRIDDTTDLIHLKRAGREHTRMTRRLALRLQAMEQEIDERARLLEQANEQLRSAASGPREDIMRQLAAAVAHDFNDLMTVISGSLSIIEDTASPPSDLRQLTATMQRAIERGSHLTSRLLSVGRGSAALPGPLALNNLLRDFSPSAAPVGAYTAASGDAPLRAEPLPLTSQGVGGCGRILVVEDDPDVLRAVVGTVGRLGYRTLAARDGQEALATLDGPEPLDLLFTDIVMPKGMNGIQLARRAREIRPNLAVLLTSGYGFNALSETDDDGFPILQKPYPREALAERLRNLIRS